ncbi:hypothetical protein PN36_17405 [Candidatus Thiomargarita nelsonii]|uniref:Uncharacterized protein n=1 Tax=Candidatus Thiomargarita nelsonii TaxID=1003181 RepID=A0A4E0QPN0_9GAMM|nr:hypothetical protein PN36_17405 [Candidatus Thiomargarita nelsonii]
MTTSKEPFDETAKAFYRHLFKTWGVEVETEREVFSHARTIDLVVSLSEADRDKLRDTVFAHFKSLNALELKGINDPLTLAEHNRILMRAWALGAIPKSVSTEHQEEDNNESVPLPNQMTVTIVCVMRPDKILTQLRNELKFKRIEAGIYHCKEVLEKWIICPSELALVPKNYPLLPLARGKRLEKFISLCVREGLNDYLRLILDIGLATSPEAYWRKILEVKQMRPMIREDTWPIIDQFFREMPEAIGKLPTFQEALADSLKQGKQQGIQQGKKIGEQQGALHNEHRLVLRQLQRRFNQVPKGIVQQIEATSDLEQLDQWLVQIITAKELEEIKRLFQS